MSQYRRERAARPIAVASVPRLRLAGERRFRLQQQVMFAFPWRERANRMESGVSETLYMWSLKNYTLEFTEYPGIFLVILASFLCTNSSLLHEVV